MKNALKLFGIIAFVAVIGFSMISCGDDGDDGQGDLLNGTWDRGDIIVTFSGSTGVFTQINSGSVWEPVLNNGLIKIGDRKFRNITYEDNLKWTGQELAYETETDFGNGSWEKSILTISGQTLRVETENAASPFTTYTRQ
jgi:hypothetical protein